ncbi:unnamed protein product [Polarella glacialis]|uniref:Uncharacterized protein n=1 Tax=Polarella glacialis TaxID=89957 RepID=A0A813H3E5_POLGL|nr:unnamed protein product [Polarella glacialis]
MGKWILFVGAMYLRSTASGCPAPGQPSSEKHCFAESRAGATTDGVRARETVGAFRVMAPGTLSWVVAGSSSSRTHEYLLGVARVVHAGMLQVIMDLEESFRSNQRCAGPVQVVEGPPGRSVVRHYYLAASGAASISSTNADFSASSYGVHSTLLGLAEECSPALVGILCIIETYRIYHVGATQLIISLRSRGWTLDVCSDKPTKDFQAWRPSSACSRRRAFDRAVSELLSRQVPSIRANLVWISEHLG